VEKVLMAVCPVLSLTHGLHICRLLAQPAAMKSSSSVCYAKPEEDKRPHATAYYTTKTRPKPSPCGRKNRLTPENLQHSPIAEISRKGMGAERWHGANDLTKRTVYRKQITSVTLRAMVITDQAHGVLPFL